MTTPEQTPLLAEDKKKKGVLGRAKSGIESAAKVGVNLGEKLGSGYVKACSDYDMLFYKHKNRVFGDHLEVASRGACFVIICALPFITPHEVCPMCEALVESEIYTAASITYFIYTLYIYLGDILHFAQGGVAGSFLAVLSIWTMQGIWPGGYTASKPHRWYFGSLWGICFVFLILWLNFDDNTRIFSLSTYVWYWMAFLKPDATAGFAQNFEIKFNGKAMRELMVAIAGCTIAVIAGYFPYPIYAHKKALEISRSMMDQIFMAKRDFVEYYCGGEEDLLKTKILAREAHTLRAESGSIAGLLDSAWYECMGYGPWQKQRVMMKTFLRYVEQTVDLLSNAFNVGLKESFDENHIMLMSSIRSDLDGLIESNGKVLQTCCAILVNAECDETLRDFGQKHVDEANKHLMDLTATFRTVRMQENLALISDDISGENVVGLTFAKITEDTKNFFHALQGEQKEEQSWRQGGGILGIFEPALLFDPEHLSWTLRNGLSIVLAFYAGWHGYNKYISQYNAALASTVSVLLSKFVGSAMTKNLARLQGVVIGIVLGNLLYAFLGWCYWWGHMLVGLALYFWTLMGLFLYYHSENYSTVGLLLVVFGCAALLRPCSNSDTEPSGHNQIVDVTVAIVIMSVVDALLSRERASDMAIEAYKDAQVHIREYVENLFNPEVSSMKARRGTLATLIGTAKSLGGEAALEPRYWRRDWATRTFDQGVECLATIRFCLNAMESAVLDDPDKNDNRRKTQAFLKAIAMPEFAGEDGVLQLLKVYYIEVMESLQAACGENSCSDVFVERMKELNRYKTRETEEIWPEKIEAFAKAINKEQKSPRFRETTKVTTLQDDTLAEICVFMEALKSMFTQLDKALHAIVKQP